MTSRRLAVALLVLGACAREKRQVERAPQPVAPMKATKRAPQPGPGPTVAPPEGAAADPMTDPGFDEPLVAESALASRRARFAHAVAVISADLGAPITEETALADNPCGGWSGPQCSNLTVGLEIAKTCAPIVASFHRKRTAEITAVLAEAISLHSVWHDAYGYVRQKLKKGPGYTYAGCLFSRCDPASFKNGQVDGILYQAGRILGLFDGPECGPDCTLTF
ncbi:MAG TPA: hypothetical protein VMZ28_18730 [Kofleriaceae bacterium]|nr:hypothetical protein [Kofleriaceae bacterium]